MLMALERTSALLNPASTGCHHLHLAENPESIVPGNQVRREKKGPYSLELLPNAMELL